MWVASSQCLSGCEGITNAFDASKSSTFTNTNQAVDIQYGSGSVSGSVGELWPTGLLLGLSPLTTPYKVPTPSRWLASPLKTRGSVSHDFHPILLSIVAHVVSRNTAGVMDTLSAQILTGGL